MRVALPGLIGLALALLSLGGAGEAEAKRAKAPTSTLHDIACPVPAPPDARCLELITPEAWNGKSGRTVRSRAVVLPALSPTKQPDPVVFLTGGPGVSAFAALGPLSMAPLRLERDLIVYEPRGYGYAEPALLCAGVAQLAECRAEFDAKGIDVTQFVTEAKARDLEALRKALGAERWNLFGVSFGTFWALTYTRLFPEPVRALLLDSPYPPLAGYDWNRESFLNTLTRIQQACAADAACAQAYPNLRDSFINTMRALAEQPAARPDGKALTAAGFFAAVYDAAYDSLTLPKTPALIDAAARQDWERFAALQGGGPPGGEGLDPRRAYALGLNASVECADDIPFTADAKAAVTLLEPWPDDIVAALRPEGGDYDRRCAAWPMPASPPALNAAVRFNGPALILAGAFDPITPVEFGRAALADLPNGSLLVDPAAAHAVAGRADRCILGLALLFLSAPEQPVDRACLAQIRPVRWVLPE